MTERHISPDEAIERERDRCEAICADLENRWRQSAQRLRRDGTWKTGWPFRSTFVAPKWEQAAKDTEAAADGIAAIRKLIRSGAALGEIPAKEGE